MAVVLVVLGLAQVFVLSSFLVLVLVGVGVGVVRVPLLLVMFALKDGGVHAAVFWHARGEWTA